jgi:hypothetical protein
MCAFDLAYRTGRWDGRSRDGIRGGGEGKMCAVTAVEADAGEM